MKKCHLLTQPAEVLRCLKFFSESINLPFKFTKGKKRSWNDYLLVFPEFAFESRDSALEGAEQIGVEHPAASTGMSADHLFEDKKNKKKENKKQNKNTNVYQIKISSKIIGFTLLVKLVIREENYLQRVDRLWCIWWQVGRYV